MNYRSLLLISTLLITPNYTCPQAATSDLFKSIELADYAAFNEAIAQGAYINGINPNTGNTPLIESLCKVVETITQVSSRRGPIAAASVCTGVLSTVGLGALADKYKHSWPSFVASLAAGIGAGFLTYSGLYSYFIQQKEMSIPALIQITHTLMKHPSVDLNKENESTATSARNIINDVLSAYISSYTYYTTDYHSYHSGGCHGWQTGFSTTTPHTVTQATFVVNGTTYRVSESFYYAQIKPVFKNIQKLMR